MWVKLEDPILCALIENLLAFFCINDNALCGMVIIIQPRAEKVQKYIKNQATT